MLFNSYEFVFYFFPIALVGYFALPFRARSLWLTVLSYVFYGWFSPRFCVLMLISTALDYFCGRGIHSSPRPRVRKAYLTASLVGNLGMLGFFKYFDFFAENINQLVGADAIPLFYVVLPIGISFYTFQSMSYSLDIYRGASRPARNFIDFAQYVSLFPQLLAGPIVRYAQLDEQIRHRTHTVEKATRGARLFIIGLGKKVLLADTFALVADSYFVAPTPGLINSWIGSLGYTLQVYFDFSGYSDMAIGLGLMFGYQFPINFNSPLKSRNVPEIWRRWHMTLSFWLRDYLYIPLGGSRVSASRFAFNTVFTMVLVGFWHGAAWNYILFGFYHGFGILFHRVWTQWRGGGPMPVAPAVTITFLFWVTSMAIFRAEGMARVVLVYSSLFGLHGLGDPILLPDWWLLTAMALGLFIVMAMPNSNEIVERRFGWARVAMAIVLLLISLGAIFVNDETPFLYYQF